MPRPEPQDQVEALLREDAEEMDYGGPLDCECNCRTRQPCARDAWTDLCYHCECDHA